MRKKPTRKRPYFKMESAMTAILRDASGNMHHGILFDPPLDRCINYASLQTHRCIQISSVQENPKRETCLK